MPIRFASIIKLIPGMRGEPIYFTEWLNIQLFGLIPEAIRAYFTQHEKAPAISVHPVSYFMR